MRAAVVIPLMIALVAMPRAISAKPDQGPVSPNGCPDTGQRPEIAIIIDDCGESEDVLAPFLAIPAPITFSVLTSAHKATQITEMLVAKGRDVWAHIPMEPNNPSAMKGGGYLTTSMSDQALIAALAANLTAVPGAKGINNHTGSRLTRDSHRMLKIAEFLARMNLYFVDSRTDNRSVAITAARAKGVLSLARDVFLDDRNDTKSPYENLLLLEKKAIEKGFALGIGHPGPKTAEAIARFAARPDLCVDLVSATHLIGLHCRPQSPQNPSE